MMSLKCSNTRCASLNCKFEALQFACPGSFADVATDFQQPLNELCDLQCAFGLRASTGPGVAFRLLSLEFGHSWGLLIIRTGFWALLCSNYNKEPPK